MRARGQNKISEMYVLCISIRRSGSEKNLQVNFSKKNFSVLFIFFKKFEPFPSKILTSNTNFKEWSFTNFKLTRNLDHSVNNYLLQLHDRATSHEKRRP